jgi:hypothetical protein
MAISIMGIVGCMLLIFGLFIMFRDKSEPQTDAEIMGKIGAIFVSAICIIVGIFMVVPSFIWHISQVLGFWFYPLLSPIAEGREK